MQSGNVTSRQLELIRELEETGKFRVLRAIEMPGIQPGVLRPGERLAIVLDTETTGLDIKEDEIVEIAMILFAYDEKDQFTRVVGLFEGMREPATQMSEDAANITGITAEMLKGKKIDIAGLEHMINQASLIIAHNAAFDRPMCEKLSTVFKEKAWACSATEIPWRSLGYEGVKLGYLLYQAGFFHKGHRALEDCYALLSILSAKQKVTPMCGLQLLLASARETRVEIEVSSPFELRGFFKKRGYRWKSYPTRHWCKDIPEGDLDRELEQIDLLKQPEVRAVTRRQTAFDRFKTIS